MCNVTPKVQVPDKAFKATSLVSAGLLGQNGPGPAQLGATRNVGPACRQIEIFPNISTQSLSPFTKHLGKTRNAPSAAGHRRRGARQDFWGCHLPMGF